MQTATRLSRVLIYRGVVEAAARFKAVSRSSSEPERTLQPPGAEDGSPGEGLLVPQDDGVGQGRG